jgi:lysozyme
MNGMLHSFQLRLFVQAKETLRLKAYLDGRGVPTIGWGHTRGVKLGDTCDMAQASVWLDEDLRWADEAIGRLVRVPLQQHQHDALVSWMFNCGENEETVGSQLLKKVNGAENDAAVVQLIRWGKSGGKYINGLLGRRAGEGLMYAFGIYNAYS